MSLLAKCRRLPNVAFFVRSCKKKQWYHVSLYVFELALSHKEPNMRLSVQWSGVHKYGLLVQSKSAALIQHRQMQLFIFFITLYDERENVRHNTQQSSVTIITVKDASQWRLKIPNSIQEWIGESFQISKRACTILSHHEHIHQCHQWDKWLFHILPAAAVHYIHPVNHRVCAMSTSVLCMPAHNFSKPTVFQL